MGTNGIHDQVLIDTLIEAPSTFQLTLNKNLH